jgi:membrane fusion protein (multidrug efflux system)
VRSALAQLDMARLQLGYTEVKATIDGVIGPMDLQVGDFVNPGQQVFSIVSAHPYIEANYKETQLTHVRPGMKVKVTVDTYPGLEWHGKLTSISPASGLELSLLPPQNATGNWVKVVQRIPVRFELDFPPRYPPLRAGMSVIATIDIGHHRGYWMRQGAEALLTQSDDHGAVSAAPMASTTIP